MTPSASGLEESAAVFRVGYGKTCTGMERGERELGPIRARNNAAHSFQNADRWNPRTMFFCDGLDACCGYAGPSRGRGRAFQDGCDHHRHVVATMPHPASPMPAEMELRRASRIDGSKRIKLSCSTLPFIIPVHEVEPGEPPFPM